MIINRMFGQYQQRHRYFKSFFEYVLKWYEESKGENCNNFLTVIAIILSYVKQRIFSGSDDFETIRLVFWFWLAKLLAIQFSKSLKSFYDKQEAIPFAR